MLTIFICVVYVLIVAAIFLVLLEWITQSVMSGIPTDSAILIAIQLIWIIAVVVGLGIIMNSGMVLYKCLLR